MTEQQKDFVHMYLKHRDKIIAHNLAYGNNSNYDSVESSANRLMRNPEIAEAIRSVEDTLRHEVEEEFKAKYREELLTIYDKRRILKKIATGEMYIEQKYKGKNCTQCSQYISPTYHIMMNALKEDSKLAGHYPHKVNGKWVVPALQTEQEQEEMISILKKDNDKQQTEVLSPAGGGVSLSADGGGMLAQDENPEHPDSYRETTTEENTIDNTSPRPNGCSSGRASGGGGEHLPQDQNPPETDNKRQQIEKISIVNQPFTDELKTHETPLRRHSFNQGGTVNSSGKMIFPRTLKKPSIINR